MKKFSPIAIVHLVLMVGLFLCATFSATLFFGRFEIAVADKGNAEILLTGCTMLVVMLMLLTGMMYLFNEYRKTSAIFYKVFLCLVIAVVALVIELDIGFTTVNALLIAKTVLSIIKIFVLLILAFWKNLGKKRTLILFAALLLLDVVSGTLLVLNMMNRGFDFSIVGVITPLIADGTIALAIHGKYADKAERGSK